MTALSALPAKGNLKLSNFELSKVPEVQTPKQKNEAPILRGLPISIGR